MIAATGGTGDLVTMSLKKEAGDCMLARDANVFLKRAEIVRIDKKHENLTPYFGLTKT